MVRILAVVLMLASVQAWACRGGAYETEEQRQQRQRQDREAQEDAIRRTPPSALANYERGMALIREGKPREGASLLRTAADSGSGQAALALSDYFMRAGDSYQGSQWLERAAALGMKFEVNKRRVANCRTSPR